MSLKPETAIVGGQKDDITLGKECETFEAKNKTWQKRANIPIGPDSIIWGSLVYYQDCMFYFGGYIGSGPGKY